MNNICALKTMIPGYDVSHYQPNLNIHAQMKAAGKKFCIIKCIEGVNINDRLFAAHWKEAKNQGMINNNLKVFWISVGGKTDIAYNNCQIMLGKLDELKIKHSYYDYPGGHTWPVWRNDLYNFAPLLFK